MNSLAHVRTGPAQPIHIPNNPDLAHKNYAAVDELRRTIMHLDEGAGRQLWWAAVQHEWGITGPG